MKEKHFVLGTVAIRVIMALLCLIALIITGEDCYLVGLLILGALPLR